MKKGFVYKLIYGKGNTEDFDRDKLPTNRASQLFVIFRTRFNALLITNLLCGLFWLPLLAWDLYSGWAVGEFVQGMEPAEHFSHLINLSLFQYGVDALLMMVAFIGLSGAFYVIRRLFWGQPVKSSADFFKGVKDSWKQFALIGLVVGLIVLFLQYFASTALLTMTEANSFLWTVSICLCCIAGVLLLAITAMACAQSSLYNVKFGKLISNSAVLTFKKLLTSLGVCILSVLPFVVCWYLPWIIAKLVVACVVLTVGIYYAVSVQTAFCLNVFDKFINKTDYPDFVELGLRGGKNVLDLESVDKENVALEKDDDILDELPVFVDDDNETSSDDNEEGDQ